VSAHSGCASQGAKTDGERVVVILCMIIGAAGFAYVIGNICSLVAALDPETAEYVTQSARIIAERVRSGCVSLFRTVSIHLLWARVCVCVCVTQEVGRLNNDPAFVMFECDCVTLSL
jgi:hypothetical protein